MHIKKYSRGYVSLYIALTVSVGLTLIITSLSIRGYSLQRQVLYEESKQQSFFYALSCAEYVVVMLMQNPDSSFNEDIDIDQKGWRCMVEPQNPHGFIISALVDTAATKLKIDIDMQQRKITHIEYIFI